MVWVCILLPQGPIKYARVARSFPSVSQQHACGETEMDNQYS